MRIGRLPSANQAGLGCDELQMCFVVRSFGLGLRQTPHGGKWDRYTLAEENSGRHQLMGCGPISSYLLTDDKNSSRRMLAMATTHACNDHNTGVLAT